MRKLLLGTSTAVLLSLTANVQAATTVLAPFSDAVAAASISAEGVFYNKSATAATVNGAVKTALTSIIGELDDITAAPTAYTFPTIAGVTLTEKSWYTPNAAFYLNIPVNNAASHPAAVGGAPEDWMAMEVRAFSIVSKYAATGGTPVTVSTALASQDMLMNALGGIQQWAGLPAVASAELTTEVIDLAMHGKVFRVHVGDPDSDSSFVVSLYATYKTE